MHAPRVPMKSVVFVKKSVMSSPIGSQPISGPFSSGFVKIMRTSFVTDSIITCTARIT